MPGEVTLEHQLGKDFMPVTGGSQLTYVLLEAKPTEMMAQVRMPLNFALVLDHSGSMKGAKLRNVKEAVKMVIDRLEPTDYVSVVIFDDTAQVVIPSLPANDKPGMKATIDQIRDAGGTTMSLGMIQGLNELHHRNIPNAVKVLPIISDFGQSVLSDRQIVIPLGDLEKDRPQSVLVELMIDPRPAGLFRIAQTELSYDVPTTNLVGERIRDDIKVTFTTDANQAAPVNAYVMNMAEKANAHRLVTRVLDEYKRTGKATTRLAPNVTRVLDEETQAALAQISQGQQISQDQVKSIGNKTRKLTQRLDDIIP